MRHFGHIAPQVRQRLFHREPGDFTADSPARVLAAALGATLYSPATRPRLADDILKQAARGVVSMVLCLEDSIADAEVADAEENLVRQFAELAARAGDGGLPLLFVRVRAPSRYPTSCGGSAPPCGCCPDSCCRSSPRNAACPSWRRSPPPRRPADAGSSPCRSWSRPSCCYLRDAASRPCDGISRTVDKYRDRVLALRLGVTDFCSAYGLRRAPDMTAYDVQVVASVIADVVNMLGRADGTGFTVTGPVWEYFRVQERMFKPQLRRSPFLEGRAEELRAALIEHDLDGLLREIELDRANGLHGQDLHPPLPCAARARAVRGQPRGVQRRPGHPPARARRRRRAALGVHEQDERGEAAPRLGRAHPAARRGLRRRPRGRRLRRAARPAGLTGPPADRHPER